VQVDKFLTATTRWMFVAGRDDGFSFGLVEFYVSMEYTYEERCEYLGLLRDFGS
jgi:hypothetical protein